MKTKKFVCPHCNVPLAFNVDFEIHSIRLQGDEEGNWEDSLNDAQKSLLQFAETTGVLKAFTECVSQLDRIDKPSNMKKYFFNFFKMARPKAVPSFALELFRQKFGGYIQTFGAQGILLVVSDGAFRLFIPQEKVVGQQVRFGSSSQSKTKFRMNADESGVTDWIKTRFGYVAHAGCFFDEFKKKSIGEFEIVKVGQKGGK